MTTISDPRLQELFMDYIAAAAPLTGNWRGTVEQVCDSHGAFVLALNERLQAAEKMATQIVFKLDADCRVYGSCDMTVDAAMAAPPVAGPTDPEAG